MDELLPKIFAIVLVIAGIIFDWPRAIAGSVLGLAGRYFKRRWLFLIVGVPLIAGAGEAIYPLIGRTEEMSWASFATGIVVAGVTAYGVFRVLWNLFDSVSGANS